MYNSLNFETAYQELKEEKDLNDIVIIHLENETVETYKDDFEIFRDYSEVCDWFNCGISKEDNYYRKHNDNERMKEDYKEYYDIMYKCWIVLH